MSEAVWTPSERELERRSVRRRDRTRGILVATTATVVLVALLLIFGSQFTLFAMWFDMESNKDLR